MQRKNGVFRMGLSELLTLGGVLVMLGVLVAPVVQRAAADEQTACLTRVRQMATAALMYDQDNNGRFPGVKWVQALSPYLGNQAAIFHCPAVPADEKGTTVNYGYSGLLLRSDGGGVNETQINAPTEIGVVGDADPARLYPNGGVLGGGGLQSADMAVQPVSRHAGGIVIGYADGHAAYLHEQPGVHDADNEITRAFYTAGTLGLLNNPVGGVSDFTLPDTPNTAPIAIGGDFCTYALLTAAADAWQQKAGANYYTRGYLGQYFTTGRPTDYLWGYGDGEEPKTGGIPIARDAVVVIVGKESRIAIPAMRDVHGGFVLDRDLLAGIFVQSYLAKELQVYTYDTNSGTARFFRNKFADEDGTPLKIGDQAVVAANDEDMVDKVSMDPYAIGYCSAVFADPDRVRIVDLRLADGTIASFPRSEPAHRWRYPATPGWPLTRTLYAECGGAAMAKGTSIANVMLAPGSPGMNALRASPLFAAGYSEP